MNFSRRGEKQIRNTEVVEKFQGRDIKYTCYMAVD